MAAVANKRSVQSAFIRALKKRYPKAKIVETHRGQVPCHNDYYPIEFTVVARNLEGLSVDLVVEMLVKNMQSNAEAKADPEFISYRPLEVMKRLLDVPGHTSMAFVHIAMA
jgi:hypothetical protein